MNRVKVGFFSMSGNSVTGDDLPYFHWHQLDHMPQQYELPGLLLGQRWSLTPQCRAARIVGSTALDPVRHIQNYLMTDPVQRTLEDFAALDRRLTEQGRFSERLPMHLIGPHQLLSTYVAPRVMISAEVVPWRAHRGVVIVVEDIGSAERSTRDDWLRWLHTEHFPELIEQSGVVGIWFYASTSLYQWPATTPGEFRISVLYVDDEPSEVATRLRPVLGQRWRNDQITALLAEPLEAISVSDPHYHVAPRD